jgi:Lon protease-like protein
MICPFEPSEKQALLEAPTLVERAKVMTAMIEMAVLDGPKDGDGARH